MPIRVSVKNIRPGDTIIDPTDNREIKVQEVANSFVTKGDDERLGRLVKGVQTLGSQKMDYRRVFASGDTVLKVV